MSSSSNSNKEDLISACELLKKQILEEFAKIKENECGSDLLGERIRTLAQYLSLVLVLHNEHVSIANDIATIPFEKMHCELETRALSFADNIDEDIAVAMQRIFPLIDPVIYFFKENRENLDAMPSSDESTEKLKNLLEEEEKEEEREYYAEKDAWEESFFHSLSNEIDFHRMKTSRANWHQHDKKLSLRRDNFRKKHEPRISDPVIERIPVIVPKTSKELQEDRINERKRCPKTKMSDSDQDIKSIPQINVWGRNITKSAHSDSKRRIIQRSSEREEKYSSKI